MLHSLDHPWIIIGAVIVTCFIWPLSPKSAVFLLLLIIAFVADIYVFAQQPGKLGPYASATDKNVVNKAMDWWDSWYSANGEIVMDRNRRPDQSASLSLTDMVMQAVNTINPVQNEAAAVAKAEAKSAPASVAVAGQDFRDPEWGPPLNQIQGPDYPLHNGLHELPPGPASFIPF
jgi:hypothetical protein